MKNNTFVCSFCRNTFEGFGNNPEPLKKYEERCCGKCNGDFVLPARKKYFKENPSRGKNGEIRVVNWKKVYEESNK